MMSAVMAIASPVGATQGVSPNGLLQRYAKPLAQAQQQVPKLNQLLIFVSVSMPTASLKQLDQQAKKIGGLLVMRGLVNHSLKDTAALLSQKGISAVIDPRLFAMYDVTAVPTFVINPTDEHPCFNQACTLTPRHDKIAGDVTLGYALEQFVSLGVHANQVAQDYLLALRRAP
tara:strand:- start:13 stop:531 length:519 start_codon:yes stop_codon:yes gene_type:complete